MNGLSKPLLILFMSTVASTQVLGVEFIAHRGASHDAPENTVAAMRLGFEQGADAGELDVHLTKDGKIVVLHDFDTARISGISNLVTQTTYAELRTLEAGQWGKWKGSQFREPIPLLHDALAVVPQGKKMFIEIKCGPELLPELENVLKASHLKPEQIVIISFGYDTVTAAKQRFPYAEVFWLVGRDKEKQYRPVDELIELARQAGVDGLNLEKGFPIDRQVTEKVHRAGLKIYVWTVDEPEIAQRMLKAGVDGITTNRPRWLREALQKPE